MLKAIAGVVVLIVDIGGEEGFFLTEMGLIPLLGPNVMVTGAVATTRRENKIPMKIFLLEHTIVIPDSCLLTS